MSLTNQQSKHLRGLAHNLHPVVMVGQHGLKPSILEELEIALDAHELIKVKVSVGERDERDQAIAELMQASGADLVQRIGNIAVLFRRNTDKPKIVLPPA